MKTILIPALLVASLLASSNAFAKNDGASAVRAAKASGCLAFNENNTKVDFETTTICLRGNDIQVAHVYTVEYPRCDFEHSRLRPCRPILTLRADVTFGCDGDVAEVECY